MLPVVWVDLQPLGNLIALKTVQAGSPHRHGFEQGMETSAIGHNAADVLDGSRQLEMPLFRESWHQESYLLRIELGIVSCPDIKDFA